MKGMKIAELQDKLVAAARSEKPCDKVPFAFEKRVMARIAELPAIEQATEWASALWRSATACLVVAVLSAAWVLVEPAANTGTLDFSDQLENAVLVAVDLDTSATDSSW